MRKYLLPLALGAGLALGGCTAYGNPLGAILGGNSYDNNRLSQFERAAADACAREASRYGRVSLRDVDQVRNDIVEVRGVVQDRSGRSDSFRCAFRSDGRIVDFRF